MTTRFANNFDALRFLAAVLVIQMHSFHMLEIYWDPVTWLTREQLSTGGLGVGIFFAISGYLVTQSASTRNNIGQFLLARAARIYPGYAVALVASLGLASLAAGSMSTGVSLSGGAFDYVAQNLMLNGALTVAGAYEQAAPHLRGAINGSLWTIPAECGLYVVVGLAVWLKALNHRWVALALMGALGVLFVNHPHLLPFVDSDNPLLRYPIACFFGGACLFVMAESGTPRWWMLLAAYGFWWVTPNHPITPFLLALCTALLTYLLAHEPRIKAQGFGKYGDVSYGMYLYSFPLQLLILHAAPGLHPMTFFVISLIATLPVAMASWVFVERPFLRLLRRIDTPRYSPERRVDAFGAAND